MQILIQGVENSNLAAMLKIWESKGPWAVMLYNLNAGC